MRQIVLDTETTGLEPSQGHKIIEIGCVELINRKLTGNHYHQYINPEREIEAQAIEIHGITNEFVKDKPTFADIAKEFMAYVKGAELVIHNAPFDIGFIDHELTLLKQGYGSITDVCSVVDSLVMARQKHPGQRNNLDALCKRYYVDNSQRDLHGALLDSEILADVYLLMTGGQTALSLGGHANEAGRTNEDLSTRKIAEGLSLPVLKASQDELTQHNEKLQSIQKASGDNCVWLKS